MDTEATPQQIAKSYKHEKNRILLADRAQHQHTMEGELSLKISINFSTHLSEIHSQNGLIHQNLIIINVDQSTEHQETGPPPQDEIFIPETAADRETVTTALILITTAAKITGTAAGFLEIPRTTVGNTGRIRRIQLLKN
jgi:hypothetical protein